MDLAITICATKSYQYALRAQARHIQQNLCTFKGKACLILVTDKSNVETVLGDYRELLGQDVPIYHIPLAVTDGHTNYKEDAQLTIAQMRQVAFCKARSLGANQVWSLDSDVLPPANALKCMRQVLDFDDGYYGVATCPYPSQGGGGWLFGRGSIHRQIAEDVEESERELTPELTQQLAEHRALIVPNEKPSKEWQDKANELNEQIKQCPPKGNVWKLNAKGWRKRGWGDMAYPAIGKGSIVPSDWCGMGNTLIGEKALRLCDFTGYEGKGTEDLFLCWNCWYPNGIRIAALPHCLSHHVIRNKDKEGYTLCYGYHETEGDAAGHIRVLHKPWYDYAPGEKAVLTAAA